jgi:ribulose-phosphate 3-epimerase
MATICPTITAFDPHEYREQIERVSKFAKRLHIDLMDGVFAPTKSPELERTWWPHHIVADIHLMYQRPMDYLDMLIKLKPHMVIIHNEVDVHHMHFSAELHKHGIKTGLALLAETPEEWAEQIMHSFDHLLIFSGDLGRHGGHADLSLLDKIKKAKAHHPELEISWDGGITDQNAKALVDGGVDVLNVGGFVQKAENPQQAYATLEAVINQG